MMKRLRRKRRAESPGSLSQEKTIAHSIRITLYELHVLTVKAFHSRRMSSEDLSELLLGYIRCLDDGTRIEETSKDSDSRAGGYVDFLQLFGGVLVQTYPDRTVLRPEEKEESVDLNGRRDTCHENGELHDSDSSPMRVAENEEPQSFIPNDEFPLDSTEVTAPMISLCNETPVISSDAGKPSDLLLESNGETSKIAPVGREDPASSSECPNSTPLNWSVQKNGDKSPSGIVAEGSTFGTHPNLNTQDMHIPIPGEVVVNGGLAIPAVARYSGTETPAKPAACREIEDGEEHREKGLKVSPKCSRQVESLRTGGSIPLGNIRDGISDEGKIGSDMQAMSIRKKVSTVGNSSAGEPIQSQSLGPSNVQGDILSGNVREMGATERAVEDVTGKSARSDLQGRGSDGTQSAPSVQPSYGEDENDAGKSTDGKEKGQGGTEGSPCGSSAGLPKPQTKELSRCTESCKRVRFVIDGSKISSPVETGKNGRTSVTHDGENEKRVLLESALGVDLSVQEFREHYEKWKEGKARGKCEELKARECLAELREGKKDSTAEHRCKNGTREKQNEEGDCHGGVRTEKEGRENASLSVSPGNGRVLVSPATVVAAANLDEVPTKQGSTGSLERKFPYMFTFWNGDVPRAVECSIAADVSRYTNWQKVEQDEASISYGLHFLTPPADMDICTDPSILKHIARVGGSIRGNWVREEETLRQCRIGRPWMSKWYLIPICNAEDSVGARQWGIVLIEGLKRACESLLIFRSYEASSASLIKQLRCVIMIQSESLPEFAETVLQAVIDRLLWGILRESYREDKGQYPKGSKNSHVLRLVKQYMDNLILVEGPGPTHSARTTSGAYMLTTASYLTRKGSIESLWESIASQRKEGGECSFSEERKPFKCPDIFGLHDVSTLMNHLSRRMQTFRDENGERHCD